MGNVAAPGGGLVGNSNYYISSDCNPITGLTVTIEITQNITVPLGMSFQLNCYSPANAQCVWQQYVLTFVPSATSSGSATINWMIDNWPSDAYRQLLKIKSTSDLINQQKFLLSVPGSSTTLPAGYKFTIALANDTNNNITGVTYTAADNQGDTANTGLITLEGLQVSNGTPSQKIGPGGIAPILAFELNVVGEDNGNVTLLESGAATINFTATSPLYVSNTQPGCTAAQGTGTEEQSNAAYSGLAAGPSNSITQTMTAPAAQFRPGSWFAASQRFGAPPQTDVFAIGPNGQLQLYSVVGTGTWTGPTPIGPANLAPSGASLAASQQFGVAAGQTDVFMVGQNGQLQVFWAVGNGSWNGPIGIGPTGLAPAGAHVCASQQFGVAAGQTDVFMVGQNGQLQVFWAEASGGWSGPLGIGPTGFAPAGAPVAVSQQFGAENQTNVFVVNNSGQLNTFWAEGSGAWQGPVPISAAGFATAGAHVAVSQQFGAANQTDVFTISKSGQLCTFWVESAGTWNGPVQISAPGYCSPIGAVVATQQFGAENQTNVAVIDAGGQMNIFFIENASPWAGPVQLGPGGFAPPGSPVAASQQFGATNQTDLFTINNAGQPQVFWVVAANTWGGPSSF